jgi:hypothetical protein
MVRRMPQRTSATKRHFSDMPAKLMTSVDGAKRTSCMGIGAFLTMPRTSFDPTSSRYPISILLVERRSRIAQTLFEDRIKALPSFFASAKSIRATVPCLANK